MSAAAAALARRRLALPARSCRARHTTEWVALADGVRLATTLLIPNEGAGPWPAVLVRTAAPAQAASSPAARLGRLVAETGYAVVLQECRGRQASEGVFAPFADEANDGAQAIAWLARQPWFDGRLALAGAGYAGFTAWAALSHSPLPVRAFVAAFAARDPFAWLRPGGALALETALRWGLCLGEREAVAARRLDLARGLLHRPLREADRVTLRRVDWFREWVDHASPDAYWSARAPALPETPPPALLVTGWGHAALAPQLADFAALRERARAAGTPPPELVIGPWPAGRAPRRAFSGAREDARAATLRATLEFLARRLRGEPAARAPVRVFVRGAGVWREASAWPEPACEPTAFHLRGRGPANGRAGAGELAREAPPDDAPADGYSYDPRDPVPADDPGAVCRWDVLSYTSESLSRPLVLGGPVRVVLWAASSAALTDFTATLVALAADGTPQPLCEGVVRSAGEPGQVRRLELDLGATCARLESGQRLRLALSSSGFPRWDRPSHTRVDPGAAGEDELAPAQQTVYRDRERASHVLLPVLSA